MDVKEIVKSLNVKFENIYSFNYFNTSSFSGISAYVDGGNSCIINTPWYCLHFIRAAFCLYEGTKLKEMKKWDFYALAKKENPNSEASIILFDSPSFFNCPTATKLPLMESGNYIRELFENAVIDYAVQNYVLQKKPDFIVKDGLLNGIKCSIPIIGLAKTSETIDLNLSKQKGQWFVENHVKLNSQGYVFRYELQNAKQEDFFPKLAYLSRDLVFPGYPYGLIMADRLARVSDNETSYLYCMFESKAGKEWQNINHGIRALNAHTILDNVF